MGKKKGVQEWSSSNTFNTEELINKHFLRKKIADKLTGFSVDDSKRVLQIIAPTGIGKGVCIQGFFAGIKKDDAHRVLLISPRLVLINEFIELVGKAAIKIENYHTSGMEKNSLLKTNNSERSNMVFCVNTFKFLLEGIRSQQTDFMLNSIKTGGLDANVDHFFKDYILIIDEYHLLDVSLVSSLEALLLSNESVKLVFISATPDKPIINKFRDLLNPVDQFDYLCIEIDEAIEAGIIRPYLVLSPLEKGLKKKIKEKDVSVIWKAIQDVVEKKYFGIPIKDQKVLLYVPRDISKDLVAFINKSTSKENYYNLVGVGGNIKNNVSTFNDKDFRKGIAICYDRLKEGSNNSPNIILNFQKLSLNDMEQMAGRLCRKLEGEEEMKQTFGLFVNFGTRIFRSTIRSSISNSIIADFSKGYEIMYAKKIEKETTKSVILDMENDLLFNQFECYKNTIEIPSNPYRLFNCDNFKEEEDLYGVSLSVPNIQLNELNYLKNQVILNEKEVVNYQKINEESYATIKDSILNIQRNRNLLDVEKTNLRNNFYNEVYQKAMYLAPLYAMGQQDASEFLMPVFDIAFSANQVSESSKLISANNEVINEKKEFSSILQIPITNDLAKDTTLLFSKLISDYQKPESIKDYKNSEGIPVDITKKNDITIPLDRIELVMCIQRAIYEKTTESLTRNDIDITFNSLHFDNNKEYKVTAFIVHTKKNHTSHFITYIKEFCGRWFSYDDKDRELMSDDQINKALLQAYIVKYATSEAELPKEQSGTENFLNACWLNASLAFINSFTSIT
jgi:hypothetical protein